MKPKKDCQLKFRLTAELLEKIEAYCEQQEINKSEFIRSACEKIFSNNN